MNRDLDAKIATRFAHIQLPTDHDWMTTPHCNCVPRFSRDLIQAIRATVYDWEGDFELRRQNGHWRATFFKPSYEYEAWDYDPAVAVCEAALKTLIDTK